MTQQWVSLLIVGTLMGFLLGGSFARRAKDDKWTTALGVAFASVGVLSMGNLVIIAQKQRAALEQADEQLSCIASVVEAARATTGYNALRDEALKQYLATNNPADLAAVLNAPPSALPDCPIDWQ
jgi:hypothetical protein